MFFTVSPCDLVNFRIRLCARPKDQHWFPNLDADKDEVLKEHEVRAKERLACPGACAMDFCNQMEFVIKHVIGWDKKIIVHSKVMKLVLLVKLMRIRRSCGGTGKRHSPRSLCHMDKSCP